MFPLPLVSILVPLWRCFAVSCIYQCFSIGHSGTYCTLASFKFRPPSTICQRRKNDSSGPSRRAENWAWAFWSRSAGSATMLKNGIARVVVVIGGGFLFLTESWLLDCCVNGVQIMQRMAVEPKTVEYSSFLNIHHFDRISELEHSNYRNVQIGV